MVDLFCSKFGICMYFYNYTDLLTLTPTQIDLPFLPPSYMTYPSTQGHPFLHELTLTHPFINTVEPSTVNQPTLPSSQVYSPTNSPTRTQPNPRNLHVSFHQTILQAHIHPFRHPPINTPTHPPNHIYHPQLSITLSLAHSPTNPFTLSHPIH